MGMEALKTALDDCVINFDRRVLVTDLLQDYELAYAEVNKVLSKYISQEEKKGITFEKQFLVSGEEKDTTNQIYTVVENESKLKDWLQKLKNAESALYSVEIVGGAKTPADIFKPMKWCAVRLEPTKNRSPLHWGRSTDKCNDNAKAEVKTETKKPKSSFSFTAKKTSSEIDTNSKVTTKEVGKEEIKKVSPEIKKEKKSPSLDEAKSVAGKSNAKKGIANFFNAAKTEPKKATGVVKPPSPKKLQDFFKKTEKPTSSSKVIKEEKPANNSFQLFSTEDDNEEEEEEEKEKMEVDKVNHTVVDVDTSDDEAQLEALRRQCSDEKVVDEEENSTKKRRRIVDSDDDNEEPQLKQEKINEIGAVSEQNDNETEKSETYLDEEGFVITIKAKNSSSNKKPVKSVTPEKSPPKREVANKTPKTNGKSVAKTKQGNIMNFFNKK